MDRTQRPPSAIPVGAQRLRNVVCRWLIGHLIAPRAVHWVKHRLTCQLHLMPSNDLALTPRLFQALHLDTLGRCFILIADGVVMPTPVTFLANLIFLAHLLVSDLLRVVLMLHVLPSLYISVHLVHSTRLYCTLLLQIFVISLLTVVLCKIFRVTVKRTSEMRRLWIRAIHLSIVYELMVQANVLSHSLLILDILPGGFSSHPQLNQKCAKHTRRC